LPSSADIARDSLLVWLATLQRQRLIDLGPQVAHDCARLLSQRTAWSRDELADSLASLLARDAANWRAIRGHFLQHLGGDNASQDLTALSSSSSRSLPRPRPRPRPRLRAFLVMLLATASIGVALTWWWIDTDLQSPPPEPTLVPPETPPQLVETPQPPVPRDNPQPPSEPEVRLDLLEPATVTTIAHIETRPADPSSHTATWWPLPEPLWLFWLLLATPPVLALIASRWWHAVTVHQIALESADKRAAAARQQVQRVSTSLGVPYHVERVPPFDLVHADDAATILGRVRRGAAGNALDIPPTIDRTIAAGGRIQPTFTRGGRREVLIVLVDVESGGHPWLDGVEQVLERWRRVGLQFDRYDFSKLPTRLRSWPDAEPVGLDDLARRAGNQPLLVFSRMLGARQFSGDLAWLRTLSAWPVRAWIDLDPGSPTPHNALRERLQAAGLRRFPWTGEALVRCARMLASHGRDLHVRPARPLAPVADDALRQWAACAALVPDPTWPQLDAVRRALPELRAAIPDARAVHHLIDWARREGFAEPGREYLLGEGDRLTFDPARRIDLIARLRRQDTRRFPRVQDRLEYRARKLLVAQLEAADTHGDPFGESLRQAKQSFHLAAMHSGEAERLLEDYADSACSRELKHLVVEELELQARGATLSGTWRSPTRRSLGAWSTHRPRAPLATLLHLHRWHPDDLLRGLPWLTAGLFVSIVAAMITVGRWSILHSDPRPVDYILTPESRTVRHGYSSPALCQRLENYPRGGLPREWMVYENFQDAVEESPSIILASLSGSESADTWLLPDTREYLRRELGPHLAISSHYLFVSRKPSALSDDYVLADETMRQLLLSVIEELADPIQVDLRFYHLDLGASYPTDLHPSSTRIVVSWDPDSTEILQRYDDSGDPLVRKGRFAQSVAVIPLHCPRLPSPRK